MDQHSISRNPAILVVLLLLTVGSATTPLHAIDHDPYSKIRVRVSDRSMLVRLHELGVEVERAGKPGKDGIQCIARGKALERLRAEGIAFEVIEADLEKFYGDRLAAGPANALGFGYGSMGGYYTLEEIRQQLDSMRAVRPAVVGTRDSIGASLQGRPIWAVRMTENPGLPSQKPQVLYFAMQHAREPMGMMTLMYFMWYLTERYGSDPEVTYLLNNRDLWFIPIVNVDGYESNRRMKPNGGGMRRKNMRYVALDADNNGVDLNRNWGSHWGYDNEGSSPNTQWEDYRGLGPFSEPETQVISEFFKSKSFRLVLEYHSYWNTVFCVPGYISGESADSLLFREYVRELTRVNHYTNGMSPGAYPSNGYSSDWFYENPPTLGKTFPFLSEVGGDADGFWPATSRILPIATENLRANLFAAWAGGAYGKLMDAMIVDSSGDGDLVPGESFTAQLSLRNFGQDLAAGTSFSVSSSALQIDANPLVVGPLPAHAETTLSIQARVPAETREGVPAFLVITTMPGGPVEQRDTMGCMIGRGTVIFADDAEGEPLAWDQYWWGKSPVAHSGMWSYTDSPGARYSNNAAASMTLKEAVHIPETAGAASVRFWSRWSTEPGYDKGQVHVSTDAGISWAAIHGPRATVFDGFGYSGWQPVWVREEIDLSDMSGRDVQLRFFLSADGSYNDDGWYVDDITVRAYPIAAAAYARYARIVRQERDTVRIAARIENALAHTVHVQGLLKDDAGVLIDSVSLMDDGLHADSLAGDGLWGAAYVPTVEGSLRLTVRTNDLSMQTSRFLTNIARILFFRHAYITMDAGAVTIPPLGRTLPRFDTSFVVRNIGWESDTLTATVDPGNVEVGNAVSVVPTSFVIGPVDSQKVTFTVLPSLLSYSYYGTQVIVEAKSTLGQKKFQKNYAFQVVTSVADEKGIPTVHSLEQNYPNPFNPLTVMRYQLPVLSHVKLAVYDILGREIAVLMNDRKEPGRYDVRWDASGCPSGVYICRMTAGGFAASRKMLLTK